MAISKLMFAEWLEVNKKYVDLQSKINSLAQTAEGLFKENQKYERQIVNDAEMINKGEDRFFEHEGKIYRITQYGIYLITVEKI